MKLWVIEMVNEKKLIDTMELIAIRKATFFKYVVEEAKRLSVDIDENATENKIANADNILFISKLERKTKKLSVKNEIKELELNPESFFVKR